MDNGFGKMIYNGTILDLNKLDDIQIGQILKELQDDQSLKKNKIAGSLVFHTWPSLSTTVVQLLPKII